MKIGIGNLIGYTLLVFFLGFLFGYNVGKDKYSHILHVDGYNNEIRLYDTRVDTVIFGGDSMGNMVISDFNEAKERAK